MKKMGFEALSRKPNTGRSLPAYPYLLRNLEIDRPNQVIAANITCIPTQRGFVYLFAVVDGAGRRMLSWRVSNTLTTDFCIAAARRA